MENNRSEIKFLGEGAEENERTTLTRVSLVFHSRKFQPGLQCWGIHRISLGDLRKPAEESEPAARAYFRLPPPAGKAFKAKQDGSECFVPSQVSQSPPAPQGGVSPAQIRQEPGSEWEFRTHFLRLPLHGGLLVTQRSLACEM